MTKPEFNTRRVDLRITEDLYQTVRIIAEKEGIARADVIRKAISEYVKTRVNK
jgi:metal-responsive CopG/Arc/MetJ family transcriptional regulator